MAGPVGKDVGIASDPSSQVSQYFQNIFRTLLTGYQQYLNVYKRSRHTFDTTNATKDSYGVTYTFTDSNFKVVGWRIISVSAFGLSGGLLTIPYFHLLSSLSTSESSGSHNAKPQPIVAVLLNPSGAANPFYYDESVEANYCQPETTQRLTFTLADDQLNPITNVRFMVLVEFLHNYNKPY